MDSLPTTEVIGIGAVAVGYGILIWRMWSKHSDLTDRVIDVVSKNAEAINGLNQTVKENTEVTKGTKDTLSQLLIQSFQSSPKSSRRGRPRKK